MNKILNVLIALLFGGNLLYAQRFTDNLDRGLVAVDMSGSVFLSWRIQADESYGVTYNVYENGKLIAKNLSQSNYTHSGGSSSNTYTVKAVVNDTEQSVGTSTSNDWNWIYSPKGNSVDRYLSGRLDITLAPVYDREKNLLSETITYTYLHTKKDNTTENVTVTTARYSPNDATFADLDGDGDLEMIIKRLNVWDANIYKEGEYESNGLSKEKNLYTPDSKQFVVIDAYNINWQTGETTLMWRIDCGPNMVSLNSTEINIIAYDWDEDGKAEVVLRGADNMKILGSDGKTEITTIGNTAVNTRSYDFNTKDSQYAWTCSGSEYLIYMNGETGTLYDVQDYPLPRLETSEWATLSVNNVPYNDYVALHAAGDGNYYTKNTGVLTKAWGDNYGHRSSKYFFGAPFLDGRHASLFLGRGIYTRHKMIAMNVNKNTHHWEPIQGWSWSCNNSSSPWYGNGFHNYLIADVDEDGRDEIVYGSMVIDDNGKGLYTTGYQHGDAQHVSDFNPWRKGLEYFGCLEDNPYWGNNYRDATTGEVLYKFSSTPTAEELAKSAKAGDDGRCLMANLSNDYPGSIGRSWKSNAISGVTYEEIPEASSLFYIKDDNLSLNSRIYWDGDLLSEMLDSPGTASSPIVHKLGEGRLFTGVKGSMNNDSKNNPCFQGDLIGDWREEIVVRDGKDVCIYTTVVPSDYGFNSLWYDHQYRQAMVWQMMAYNQPPHLSYFLGELEGYTMAPPSYSMRNRIEIANNGTINSSYNGQQIIACETNNMNISVTDGAAPWVFYDNASTWVQGTDVNGTTGTKVKHTWNGTSGDGSVGVTGNFTINRASYTHTVTGGAFSGNMNLVKQGDGKLILPDVTETYTGKTDIWAGTVEFNGTFESSPVWMNRFTTFNTDGGTFNGGLTMEYDATLNVGGATAQTLSTVTVSELTLNYGARVVLDINSTDDTNNDKLNLTTLNVGTKEWENGPQYSAPVFEINATSTLTDGRYPIGTLTEVTGKLQDVVIEGDNVPEGAFLKAVNGMLYLVIGENKALDAPTIVFSSMTSSDGGYYYYPTVSIDAGNAGVETSLSGTFTNEAGETTNLNGSIYSQNYENETSITGWTIANNQPNLISLGTGDNTYGQYFYVNTGTTNTRYAYTKLNDVDVSSCSQYVIEFDLAFTNSSLENVEFCVMSKNGTMPTQNWDNYASINSNANMLFDVTGGANSTSYSINGVSTSITIASGNWYHYKLVVDQSAGTVDWTIGNGNSGTFTLPSGTSTEFAGFYLVAGRRYSEIKLDNINIYTTLSDSYTFTEPGTLTVTVSAEDYDDASATYEVPNPYAIYYESPAYNEIDAADVYSTLGDKWNDTSYNSRWAFWNQANSTYGTSYVFVSRAKWNDGYVDNDSVLKVTDTRYLNLVEGFGLGRNDVNNNLTFSADGLGDENTVIYYKVDDSAGGATNYAEGYTYANADGSWSYEVYQNHTFCKLIAWVPIDEEYSELSKVAPTGSGSGNVAMRRTFSSITNGSGWNTLVVPFDMSDRQILTTFGPGTQVAQFVGSTANSLIFNADTREIHANEPVLIRVGNVHSNNFYVFEGVTRNVDNTPKKESDYFDFLGSYQNRGNVTFPVNSYFYNINNNGNVLNRVAENNIITFKGYRAYFSAKAGVDVKQVVLTFDEADALGIDIVELQQKPFDVYSVSGQLIRRNDTTLDGLPSGVYLVGQKKVIIK